MDLCETSGDLLVVAEFFADLRVNSDSFSHRIDACTVLEAEILGIYHRICTAWNRGITKIIVEYDSVEAIELLSGGSSENHHLHHLVNSTLAVGGDEIELKCCLVGRQLNVVTDRLAKESHMISGNCVIYDSVP